MTAPRRSTLHWNDGTIAIDGPIRSDAVSAAALRRSLDELRGEPALRVMIQSSGGDADEGLAIFNLLRSVTKPIEVTVRWAASMAAIIAMAGTRIRIIEDGAFALHHVGLEAGFVGRATNALGRVTARDLIALSRDLGRIDEMHADIVTARTGMARATFMHMRAQEVTLDAHEALRFGFADEIVGMQR